MAANRLIFFLWIGMLSAIGQTQGVYVNPTTHVLTQPTASQFYSANPPTGGTSTITVSGDVTGTLTSTGSLSLNLALGHSWTGTQSFALATGTFTGQSSGTFTGIGTGTFSGIHTGTFTGSGTLTSSVVNGVTLTATSGTNTVLSGAATVTTTAAVIGDIVMCSEKTISGTPGPYAPAGYVSGTGTISISGLSTDNSGGTWWLIHPNQ